MNIKALNIRNILIIYSLLWACEIMAQDSHFSQVNKIPLLNNPGNAGAMDHDLRITNNYRSQWKSINIPFNTLHIGIDKKVFFLNQSFGLGINVLSDFTQSNIISSNYFAFTFCHSQFIKNHQITIGASLGRYLKNYDPSKFTFDEQWDIDGQLFNPNLTSGENNLVTNVSFSDIRAGLLWRSRLKNMRPEAGISVDHMNQPSLSYINDGLEQKLNRRFNVHGNMLIPLTGFYDVRPTLYYSHLKGSHNFITGTEFGFLGINKGNELERIYAMSFFRINPARNIDSFIVGGGIEFFNFDVGISYDFNISALRKTTHFQGAFEISLVFKKGRLQKSGSGEPCYML